MKLAGSFTTAPSGVAKLPEQAQRALEAAQAQYPVLPPELLTRIGLDQFSQRVHPASCSWARIDGFLTNSGARTKASIYAWLRDEAERFSKVDGRFFDFGRPDKFRDVVEPGLAERGCGVEAWTEHLRALGRGEFLT